MIGVWTGSDLENAQYVPHAPGCRGHHPQSCLSRLVPGSYGTARWRSRWRFWSALQQGLANAEHQAFVETLAAAMRPKAVGTVRYLPVTPPQGTLDVTQPTAETLCVTT